MRKLLAIGLCLLIGCSESPRNAEGNLMAEKDDHNEFHIRLGNGNGEWYFRYIEVDGHEYLIMTGTHRSGLTHSPKCPCLNRKMVFVVDQNQDIQFAQIGIELTDTYINCVTNKVIQR
jgi:hypothetical protein